MERMERLGTRTIDELGRVALPNEIRAKFGWSEKDSLAMYYVDGNTLMVQLAEKYQGQRCVFCGTTEAVTAIHGKDICGSCLEKIKAA